MAIATRKAGYSLNQAAPLLYGLPAGAVNDVTQLAGPANVTGSITDSAGTTNFSADQLATPAADISLVDRLSGLYNSPSAPAGS